VTWQVGRGVRRWPLGAVAASLGIVTAMLMQGCGGPLDKMRKDYVALEYLQDAVEATHSRPVDRPKAKHALLRAIELAPQEATIASSAPALCISLGLYAKGLELLKRQAAPDPWLLTQCLLKAGDRREGAEMALALARAARQRMQKSGGISVAAAMELNNAGYVLADASVNLEEAKGLLEIATEALPLDANCIDSLGWVYYRLGEMKKATFYLERAVRLQVGPRQPDLYYHLGAAYAAQGRPARARSMLRTALSLDPHHPDAQQAAEQFRWLLPPLSLASAQGA